MTTRKFPAPRWRVDDRASSEIERASVTPSPIELEAQAAASWLARIIPLPAPVARILGALAAFARAFG